MARAKYRAVSYKLPFKKLILNQFGAALLGVMLTAASLNNRTLDLVTSLFSVFFFMIINYNAMWDIGAKDRVRVDGGRADKDGLYGLKASLIANIPNFVLASACVIPKLIYAVCTSGGTTNAFLNGCNRVSWFFNILVRFWEAMYTGILVNIIPGVDTAGNGTVLSDMSSALYMLLYFAIIIPSLVVCTLAYRAGYNNFRVFPAKKKEN